MAEEGEARGRVVPSPGTFVLRAPPDTVARELESFREQLQLAPAAEEERRLVSTVQQVAAFLDNLSAQLMMPLTTHPAMSVPPALGSTAYRIYMQFTLHQVSILLNAMVQPILDYLRGPAHLQRDRMAEFARAVAQLDVSLNSLLAALLRSSQVLTNIIGRALPDARIRSAPTVERAGIIFAELGR